jgi:hypothetical protein
MENQSIIDCELVKEKYRPKGLSEFLKLISRDDENWELLFSSRADLLIRDQTEFRGFVRDRDEVIPEFWKKRLEFFLSELDKFEEEGRTKISIHGVLVKFNDENETFSIRGDPPIDIIRKYQSQTDSYQLVKMRLIADYIQTEFQEPDNDS